MRAPAAVVVALAVAVGGCTVVSVAKLPPPRPGAKHIQVTTGGVSQPHESLGLVQVYRGGLYLFGWVPVPALDLQTVIDEDLIPEAERRGADAVINLRFHEDQYSPVLRFVLLIPPLLLIPLPANVTMSGELVRFLPVAAAAQAP